MGLWSIDFEKKEVENRLHVSVEENNRCINLKKKWFWFYKTLFFYFSYQLFDYKRTFVNSQSKHTNSNGNFVNKNQFESLFQRFLVNKNKSNSDLV